MAGGLFLFWADAEPVDAAAGLTHQRRGGSVGPIKAQEGHPGRVQLRLAFVKIIVSTLIADNFLPGSEVTRRRIGIDCLRSPFDAIPKSHRLTFRVQESIGLF